MTATDQFGLSDRFAILERLGAGGFGAVFRAHDQVLDRYVAIKILHDAYDPTTVARFQREAKSAGRLQHPNIVTLHDFGLAPNNKPFLVMEYAAGRDLKTVLKEEGTLKVERAFAIFVQLCQALSHAHAQGILHRDIKPANVIVQKEDGKETVKLVDFGLAKLTSSDQALTKSGVALGTPYYASPESINGSEVDKRADIYSLGCLMFECLSGRPPFVGDNANATLMKHREEKPPSIGLISGKSFTDSVERIVAKALAKEPENRYQTADELRIALDKELMGRTEILTAPNRNRKTQSAVSPKSIVVVFAVVCMILVLTAFVADRIKPPSKAEVANTLKKEEKRFAARKESDTKFFNGVDKYTKKNLRADEKTSSADMKVMLSEITGRLEAVDLSRRPLDFDLVSLVEKQPTLKKLGFSKVTGITDSDLNRLLKHRIKVLVLEDMNLQNEQLEPLKDATWLESLDVGYNPAITGKGLNFVKDLPKLRTLTLTSTGIKPDELKKFMAHKPGELKNVNLTKLNLTDKDIRSLDWKNISTIDLASNPITDASIDYLVKNTKIRHLHLTDCKNLTDASIKALSQMKTLESLELGRSNFQDIRPLGKLPKLTTLDLHRSNIDDRSIEQAKSCQHLKILKLNGTKITKESIKILRTLPTVLAGKPMIIRVKDCKDFTDEDIRTLTAYTSITIEKDD